MTRLREGKVEKAPNYPTTFFERNSVAKYKNEICENYLVVQCRSLRFFPISLPEDNKILPVVLKNNRLINIEMFNLYE